MFLEASTVAQVSTQHDDLTALEGLVRITSVGKDYVEANSPSELISWLLSYDELLGAFDERPIVPLFSEGDSEGGSLCRVSALAKAYFSLKSSFPSVESIDFV